MGIVAVTGAAGKTGRRVVAALNRDGWRTRVLARTTDQAAALEAMGTDDVQVGDMTDSEVLRRLCSGADAVYHICPNFHPDELRIGCAWRRDVAVHR